MEKYTNEKLSEHPIHQILNQISLSGLLWVFDAVSLYVSAMWDEIHLYLRIETGYAFTEDMKDELVDNLNIQIFKNSSVMLAMLYYNPKCLIVQHLPIKEILLNLKLLE